MAPFEGFPDKSEFTPVPNLLFGQVLEEVDDPLALKCFLRVFWLHAHKKGSPAILTQEDLLSDRTLVRVISASGSTTSTETALEALLDRMAGLGLLLHMRVESDIGVFHVYVPNTQRGRRDIQRLKESRPDVEITDGHRKAPRPNIFLLYEENIGIITPLINEVLKDAENQYPEAWIEEAFRAAVAGNKRSWRYIAAILKRWKTDGKDDGEHWGHTKKIDAREWIRRYGLPKPPR